jgi:hypothetical protein
VLGPPGHTAHVTDPDGLQLEINCPSPDFDLQTAGEEIEEIGLTNWVEQTATAVADRAASRSKVIL